MKIRTPAKRAYYPASANEKTRLLCWIPREVMGNMVAKGQMPASLLEDHPDGLELEVTEEIFSDFGITLDMTPTQLKKAYIKLLVNKSLPPSGMVDGMALEAMALGYTMPSFSNGATFPEPDMTDGEDALTAFRRMQ
ncbi:MAG: hypothetical protein P1S60_16920 [Anaerolineae bacterium]|nr:hypothetical protein [Anaerolineae bacterium]